MGFSSGSDGKESACNVGDTGSILGSGRSLEKEMAIHSRVLAWKIPWPKERGRLQSRQAGVQTGSLSAESQTQLFTFTYHRSERKGD